MTDYRAIAMQWVAEPDHRPAVEEAARHLHYNESLHMHEDIDSKEPCGYCWLRAAKAVQAIERDGQRVVPNEMVDVIRKHRDRVIAQNEQLRAEIERLTAKLDGPCGSCHPCMNYSDETWREAGRKPPHVHEWDEARAKLHAAATVKVWTNEDGRKFVFADDLWTALDTGAA